MSGPTASVVVRTRDEAGSVVACLRSLHAQTVRPEIVLVDSGSSDATLALGRPMADVVVEMPAGEFTFGGSLNLGTSHASGAVVMALSAHCVAPGDDWVARSLAHFTDDRVAAAFGAPLGPGGTPLPQPRRVTWDDVRTDPHWGLTNTASAWRRSVWEQAPFDATLASAEDKEWMWRVLADGWDVVADPALAVDSPHRRAAGLRALWRREYLEHEIVAMRLAHPLRPPTAWAGAWWGDMPWPSRWPTWLRRLSPPRTVEHLAGALGERRGAARRDHRTIEVPRP